METIILQPFKVGRRTSANVEVYLKNGPVRTIADILSASERDFASAVPLGIPRDLAEAAHIALPTPDASFTVYGGHDEEQKRKWEEYCASHPEFVEAWKQAKASRGTDTPQETDGVDLAAIARERAALQARLLDLEEYRKQALADGQATPPKGKAPKKPASRKTAKKKNPRK